MKPGRHVGFLVIVIGLAMAGGGVLISQRQQASLLRVEREAVRLELSELERLGAENLRLRALQIPARELEVLRADHAALPRLRAEFEALKPR
jgi:hypothetical protein